MSKYDLMKNVAKKNSSKSTADSSKVSKLNQTQTRYTDTGTGGQTKKITSSPQKSTATYWQATQQSANQQATKQKTVQRKTLTGSMKRQAQVAEKEKRNKYAEATRNAQKFDPNAQQDYSQFNAGVKAIIPSLFSKRTVASEMANYTNRNRKQIAQDIAGRQRQAGYAQSAVDKANADIASNDLTKTFSDLGMKGLGGMTSSVGGLIRDGSNLVQGFAGLTGNQDLARQALQFDRNLGTEEAIANINRNNSQADTFAGKIAESIGGMIPTIGANLVGGFAGVGEQAGLGLMGASVFGNAGSEAFNNLSEDGELSQADALRALGYGGASAALEVGTEKLSDFIPGLDTFAFTNPDHILGQAGGEALEEMISSALEPFINPLADQNVRNAQQYGEQIDANTWTREHWQDILESGLLGAGTSLAMGAPANVRNAVENRYIDSLSDEDTISDGEYRESDEGLTDDEDYDELEYVPTGDTDVDAVGRLKASEEADPSNTGRADDIYNAGIDDIIADTDIPEEVAQEIKGGLKINKTAGRLAEGDAVAFNQEHIAETDESEYKQKIGMATSDVSYETTRLKPVKEIAKQMNNKIGDIDKVYDALMKGGPKNRVGKAVLNQFGIQTDYDAVLYTARVAELKDQIDARMNQIKHSIEDKGYKVEIKPTATGENAVNIMKDGKVVNPSELSETVKEFKDLATKNDDVTLRATNIGHNVGTILRLFRTDLLSPAGQIKGVNQTIEAINAELDKKFSKQIKSGEIEHVKLNDELVKTFLEADTDAKRAAVMEEMGAEIGSQIPPTFMEKLDAFRYNNLLFNGLTWIRNGIGNLNQAQMSKAKNIALYALESYMKASGRVLYSNIDRSSASDSALLSKTSMSTRNRLLNDFTDAKKTNNPKRFLRKLGYDGALLNTMQHYKGKTFDFSQIDSYLSARLNEKVASNAKDAGYTVVNDQILDKNGDAVDDKTYRKLINDSFKQARRQFLSSDELRMAKTDSIGKGKAHRTQRELFWNEGFDILNPEEESVAGLKMDTATMTSKDAFQKGLNEARRGNTFSDKNPFGWTENRISRVIDYTMNKAPFLGDDYWKRSGYSRAMASMLDAQGYHAEINEGTIELYDRNGDKVPEGKTNRVLTETNQEALQWAKEDTYHDANPLADLLNDFARQGSLAKFAVNATVPFINTPMNIARRAMEYSPIGIMSSLAQINQVKSGKMSASTWLNNMAKGATGASAMVIGAWLASMGFLRALGDKDDEQIKRFEQSKGLQNYSIQIPFLDGWSTTVDWLAPGVAPFLLGAALFEQHSQYEPRSKDETTWQKAVNLAGEDFKNFGTLFRPIADTTMLSGLMDTLAVFGDEDWAKELVATTTQNYVRQLTPVLGSKIHGIIDPVKYSTSSDSFFDSQLRAAAINIRLIDYAMTAMNHGEKYLQPQLDLNGKPIETQDYGLGTAGRAITNLINPATVKEDTRDSTDLELERLYSKHTGAKDYFLPSISASYNGIHFTPKERTEFNQYYLSSYKQAADEFIKSPTYGDYDDDERYKILYSMKNHYFAEAQAKYLGRIVPNADKVLTERDKACDFANKLGVSTPKYYSYIYTTFDQDKDGNNINNTRAMKIRAQMEADGVWDNVKKAIDSGQFKPANFNLNKLVTKWDTNSFTYYYNQMLNGQYDGKNRK